jgi:membrane protease YdiL (CAAX protease family)
MNDIRSLLYFLSAVTILIFTTLIFSAAIGPFVYYQILSFFPEVGWPYSRVFDRIAMAMALILVIIFRSHFRLTELLKDVRPHIAGKKFLPITKGFLLSFTISLALIWLIVNYGTLQWRTITAGAILYELAEAIPAALIISVIEEVFFRFFLFFSMRRYLSIPFAAVISSVLYSLVHFIQPVRSFQPDPNDWLTGFHYLVALGERYTLPGLLPAAIGLFLVGICLCLVVERSNSLLPAIGLHAGWVAAVKIIGKITEAVPGFEYPEGAGRRYYLLTHEESWLGIVLIGVIALIVFKPKEKVT